MSIPKILRNAKTIAVVGLSDKPERYSYIVASYLQNKGYRIYSAFAENRGLSGRGWIETIKVR